MANSPVLKAVAYLQIMGIPLWAKKLDKHSRIFLCEPKLFSPVWIVLESKIDPQDEAFKVLQGMLKVLNLSKEKIVLSWCLPEARFFSNSEIKNLNITDWQRITQLIQYWQPKTCLLLGSTWPETLEMPQGNCFVTYHPRTLVEAPHHKRAAYQTLLTLKAYLETGGRGL